MTDSSKTDTLNSSSSSTTTTTTVSSLEKMKIFPEDFIFKTLGPIIPVPVHPPAVLTVLRKAHPPLPPPRLTPLRAEDHNGSLMRNGGAPGREPRERERVRFSETVQYHGYCPDCDLQYDVDDTELHLQAELSDLRLSPLHCCSSSSPPPPHALPHDLMLENGGLPFSHSFPPTANPPPPFVPPHPPSRKPQKTILRKSTTTTV
ncbi:protein Largen isoform X2 [Pleuronectes platessa]|uniref:protein Largen isoform X2 n=1 Tax=Pleuronectes platessa TaxID=8262 RepID=UPI00232A2182|nr:protein Largen isoform X2 [Pleuronectes platessa]